jgi:C4-dicarboxylate transporter DctM subunit
MPLHGAGLSKAELPDQWNRHRNTAELLVAESHKYFEYHRCNQFGSAVLDAAFGLVLIIIILGGIYGGIFTPTEAAAVACVYAFFAAIMIYRDMGPLKGRGWLRDNERLPFGLGLRVVAFSVIGFILHWSLGRVGVYSEGWGTIVAIFWVIICLVREFAMRLIRG